MIIKAKFASTCPVCGKTIEIGDEIEWEPGKKAIHLACSGEEPAGAAPTPPEPYKPSDDFSDAVFRIGDVVRRKDTGEVYNVVDMARDMIEGKEILYRISKQPPGRPWYAGDPVLRASKLELADTEPQEEGTPDPTPEEEPPDIPDIPEMETAPPQETETKPVEKQTEQRPIGLDAWL